MVDQNKETNWTLYYTNLWHVQGHSLKNIGSQANIIFFIIERFLMILVSNRVDQYKT